MQLLSEHTTTALTLSKLISHFCTSNFDVGAFLVTQPVTKWCKKASEHYCNTDLYILKKKIPSALSENYCMRRQPIN